MTTDILSRLNSNGTGLNLRDLARTLVTAETAAAKTAQEGRIAADTRRLEALGQLRSAFADLGGVLAAAASNPVLAVETSSAAILPAVTDRDRLVNGTVSLGVTGLAQRQVLEFTGFAAPDVVLETGTLDVAFGSWSAGPTPSFTPDGSRAPVSFAVTAGMTLQGLAAGLSGIPGVTARVLTKGDGTFSLGIVSETGAGNALRLTASGSGSGGPAPLAGFDTTVTNAARQVQAAANAQVVVDGIAISRSSNTLTDVLPGLSITLSAVTSGTITIGRDLDVAEKNVTDLIDGLNGTLALLRGVTNRGANGTLRGELAGDAAVEGLELALRRVIAAPLEGHGDRPVSLADLGIATRRDGSLSLDRTVFERAFATAPAAFDALFGNSLKSLTDGVKVGGLPSPSLRSGEYRFVQRPDGSATLGGFAMLGAANPDGTRSYTALGGPVRGLTVTAAAGTAEATVRFGRSLVAQIGALLDQAEGGAGAFDLREREIGRSTAAANERLAQIEARAALLERRYMSQFAVMEQMVTQMKSTGTYITNLVDQWNTDR